MHPIPLYVEGAGVATGKYERLIRAALDILLDTEDALLNDAWFNPQLVRELCLDPRAYDFDHPANRRPNHHFGQWDPTVIDTKGRYRRFVLQQVTLDSLLLRCSGFEGDALDERVFEAAAVLAGTILMASAISGSGPECHDSSVTLATLLPHIASFRDRFYDWLLESLSGTHASRLRQEAEELRQPFGAARQHLNHELARRRAAQMQHVHLARLYARMGYPEAAMRQARFVPVTSARLLCQIDCLLTKSHDQIRSSQLEHAVDGILQIEDLLHRGIACGGLVDPWNIVGFGGNFSIFPAPENSVHDFRIDDLIEVVEQLLSLAAHAWSEAAARDLAELEPRFSEPLHRVATWWDQFAAPSVEGVKRLVGKEIEVSANLVAGALNAWHKAGAAAGDIAFWQLFVDQFDSPKAFQLVIEALLARQDCVASMALLIQWVSQRERTPLEDGDCSFHRLVLRWHARATASRDAKAWKLAARFCELLEANAEEYWQVPTLYAISPNARDAFPSGDELPADDDSLSADDEHDSHPEDEDADEDDLFRAAYEQVVYQDSTADGVEGDMLDYGRHGEDFPLEWDSKRIQQRLAFLKTLAKFWKRTSVSFVAETEHSDVRMQTLEGWSRQAAKNGTHLLQLLNEVHALKIPLASQSHDALLEYDRRRTMKDTLIEQIISATVETEDAWRLLQAASHRPASAAQPEWLPQDTVALLRGVLDGDPAEVRRAWSRFLPSLHDFELLYVPVARGGIPAQVVATRSRQQLVYDLLGWLPKLGMVAETLQLLAACQRIELERPVGPGAVTEFDRLFENGCQSLVRCVIASSSKWSADRRKRGGGSHGSSGADTDSMLVEALQRVTEVLLHHWLEHSRTLRLSVVEKIGEKQEWEAFVEFVERYGKDLFTQVFLNLGNLRAILHQGVQQWIEEMLEDPDAVESIRLLQDLEAGLSLETATRLLSTAMEAVVENYREYRDYNTTTTQSDRGELFYTFVDFIRLRTEYDRVAWNLKPVIVAHEILVREGKNGAAELWRRALAERTAEAADQHSGRLAALSRKQGMQLPSVAARIAERFTRPLAIDRIRAMVLPALQSAGHRDGEIIFATLEFEIDALAKEPSGAGLDLPDWLVALEEEVAYTRTRLQGGERNSNELVAIEQRQIGWEELDRQLRDASPGD